MERDENNTDHFRQLDLRRGSTGHVSRSILYNHVTWLSHIVATTPHLVPSVPFLGLLTGAKTE